MPNRQIYCQPGSVNWPTVLDQIWSVLDRNGFSSNCFSINCRLDILHWWHIFWVILRHIIAIFFGYTSYIWYSLTVWMRDYFTFQKLFFGFRSLISCDSNPLQRSIQSDYSVSAPLHSQISEWKGCWYIVPSRLYVYTYLSLMRSLGWINLTWIF